MALEIKFGPEGTALLPEPREIIDVAVLRAVGERIKTAATIDDLRQVSTCRDTA